MFLEGSAMRISTCKQQLPQYDLKHYCQLAHFHLFSQKDSDIAVPLRSPSNIRHYIQNLKVTDNQRRLTQLSRTIEC